jgi:hypothetical protein
VVAAAALIQSLYLWCSLCGCGEDHVSTFNTGPMSGRQLAIKDAKKGKIDSNSASLSRLLLPRKETGGSP